MFRRSTKVIQSGVRALSIDASSLKGVSLRTLASHNADDIRALLDISVALKQRLRGGSDPAFRPLEGRSMAMIFQKRSTRTRVSSETGIAMLGGQALFLGAEDVQLGVNETVKDTARVLSRFNDVILARVFEHRMIDELANEATVPVINALSDLYHPLQLLADLQTLEEKWGGAGSTEGKTVAWVGDGNNILHSLLMAAPLMKMNVRVSVPEGYDPDSDVLARARALVREHGTELITTRDPKEAVRGADAIVTDTWISMGQEEEKEERLRHFDGYKVTAELCKEANPDWVFLHCLPRKPQEVDDEVFYGPRSLVWDEAENRMWTVMAVLCAQLLGGI